MASLYIQRRKLFRELIEQHHPGKPGVVLVFANVELGHELFLQESSFYYLTGCNEPGAALAMFPDGSSKLYIPHYATDRRIWMHVDVDTTPACAQRLGVDAVTYLGVASAGYQFPLMAQIARYKALLEDVRSVAKASGAVYTLAPNDEFSYEIQRIILGRICAEAPEIREALVDVSALIAQMRRTKSREEIELMYRANEITMSTHAAVASFIEEGVREGDVRGGIGLGFAQHDASAAFTSIVASGKRATILHYAEGREELKDGELVVVDIGARYKHYCADVTRTYPVSGTFTKKQKKLYDLVLQTHDYIASVAKPGIWLNNKDKPKESLHHLAVAFLEKHGYAKYFPHGIGHFLGLDVHDVGDRSIPLQTGDVITIEPGIYIPEENIGIRIENDFWVVRDGVVNLTEDLPRTAEGIEELMHESPEDAEEYEDDEVEDAH